MDLSTIIGIITGLLLVLLGIGPANIGHFWNLSGIFIVVGGTVCAILASFPFRLLRGVPAHLRILIFGHGYQPEACITQLVEFAHIARRNGLLALEEHAQQQEDPFLRTGILLVADATDPDRVREIMGNDLDYLSERHEEAVGIYDKAAMLAPAFGLLGTLIGLINMLKALGEATGGQSNAALLGQGMSMALVTTFYGCLLANLFFAPIAKKLRIRNAEELLCKEIIIEGVLAIQSGENPKFLEERLYYFLAQKEREAVSFYEKPFIPPQKKKRRR